jgi:hypothetical protein
VTTVSKAPSTTKSTAHITNVHHHQASPMPSPSEIMPPSPTPTPTIYRWARPCPSAPGPPAATASREQWPSTAPTLQTPRSPSAAPTFPQRSRSTWPAALNGSLTSYRPLRARPRGCRPQGCCSLYLSLYPLPCTDRSGVPVALFYFLFAPVLLLF